MNLFKKQYSLTLLQSILLIGIGLEIILYFYGYIITPGVKLLSILAVCLISLIYLIVVIFLLPKIERANHKILVVSSLFGSVAGFIFISETILEYVLLPKDNTLMGTIEFGSVFLLFFTSSLISSWNYKNFRHGVLTALSSSFISSITWVLITLIIFYIFHDSFRQEQVFRSEGNYEDFIRSGMSNFNVFIMEDFFGAVFYHSLLAPFVAGILGIIGGSIGKLFSKIKVSR